MKDRILDWVMHIPVFLRPARVLGFLIAAVIGAFVGFVFWQNEFQNGDQRLLSPAQWVLAMGAFTAMVGWMVSSIVTVRNSVKQHTINTLLQSRLSVAYVERLKTLNSIFSPVGKDPIPVTDNDFESDFKETKDAVDALRYFLNHLEYIALAIKHGDLDEGLMKASMRGIVMTQVTVGDALIQKSMKRHKDNYCNTRWLVTRWTSETKLPAPDRVWYAILVIPVVLVSWAISSYALMKVTVTLPARISTTGQIVQPQSNVVPVQPSLSVTPTVAVSAASTSTAALPTMTAKSASAASAHFAKPP
jgi:hypothetical protein